MKYCIWHVYGFVKPHAVIYFIPRNSYSKNATGKKIYYEILKDFKPEI